MTITNDKELFEYIRNIDTGNIPVLSQLLEKYNFSYITYKEFLNLYVCKNNLLIIDARSEKEYNESHVYNALNFPVFSDPERHNVGLIYKKYSQKAALYLAIQYADPKINELRNFLFKNNAQKNNIIVYCWRGGGRSKYLSKMITDCGYMPLIIRGGFKSFRRTVYDYFYTQDFPYDLIEITGSTGTGKTELLKSISNDFPIIDLEDSAKHYSSLFGFIPYKIKNILPVQNQSAFENNIYSSIMENRKIFYNHSCYIVESESKKIGDFLIPENLYKEINSAKSIKLECGIENRVKRIKENYFGVNNEGIAEIEKIFKLKERYFRKELSNKIYEYLLIELIKGNIDCFSETMLLQIYDKKYKDKGKEPLLIINSDDIRIAASDLKDFLNYFFPIVSHQ
ncbi:MAG TPA: tRNA 2-selenouridine(34) synthase MnmH [Ignavibacteria bacterium]